MTAAVEEALLAIGRDPTRAVAAPRPYPHLAREGEAWLLVGRYWFAYDVRRSPPIVLGVFYDAADIPGRR